MTRFMRMVVAAVIKLYKSDRTTTIMSKITEIMIILVMMVVVVVVMPMKLTMICSLRQLNKLFYKCFYNVLYLLRLHRRDNE